MAKLSKPEWKAHEEACQLVDLDRPLTTEEKEFILDNWSPLAVHNVGAAGAFFTPAEFAQELMVALGPGGRMLDLCAGIGRLAYTAMVWGRGHVKRMVCIEINPEFVKVGKRVVPEAEWICADAYDESVILPLVGQFDVVISNPPFGKVATVNGNGKWLRTHAQGADVMAVEIGMKIAGDGVFIIPEGKGDYNLARGEHQKEKSISRFLEADFPGFNIYPWSCDLSHVKWSGATPKVEIVRFGTE